MDSEPCMCVGKTFGAGRESDATCYPSFWAAIIVPPTVGQECGLEPPTSEEDQVRPACGNP